ncbi:MAG TPA: HNH endonuclease signature motif containing protein [Roseiarcus sp.]|nr:HNH endonuclease signature motif containing protein [Roseiarcus sp.]
MTSPENPPSFVVRTEAEKAAFDNGFRIRRGIENGWMRYSSASANGDIWVAGASPYGPWFLSISHPGVAAELASGSEGAVGPDVKTLEFSDLATLYAAIARAYQLGASLPDAPLQVFREVTAGLPRTTEAERLTVERIGQDVFRKSLLAYWSNRCPMTGVTEPSLLRASHIVPWAECDDDAHRLDVHNGLLLSALWDAAFDAGKISFADDGVVLFHPSLGPIERALLLANAAPRLVAIAPKHLVNLERHRKRWGF